MKRAPGAPENNLSYDAFPTVPTSAAPLASLAGTTPDGKTTPEEKKSAADDLMRNEHDATSPVTATAAASTSILNETQSNSFGEAFKKYFPIVARVYNVFGYACVVTAIFILLAIQRTNELMWQAIYGVDSGGYNAPMAIAFNEKLFFDYIPNFRGKSFPYKMSFILGLALALETMIAGLAVAEQAVRNVSKDLPNTRAVEGLIYYGIAMYCINTFATRGIGAADMLHGTYESIRNFIYKYFLGKKNYFDFADDLQRFWPQVKNDFSFQGNTEQDFLIAFYQHLLNHNIASSKTIAERAKETARFLSVAVPTAWSFMLLPMWLGLAQEGWHLTGGLVGKAELSDNMPLVYSTAVSSWFFYIRASRGFSAAVAKFQDGFYERVSYLYHALLKNYSRLIFPATYLSLGAGWGLIFFTAGGSGSGFAVVMHDKLHSDIAPTANNPYPGFDTAAGYLFKVVPFEWAFEHLIVPMGGYSALVPSGVFINGGSLLNFISDCWAIQKKHDCSFKRAMGKKMFGVQPPEQMSQVVVSKNPAEELKDNIVKKVQDANFSQLGLNVEDVGAQRMRWMGRAVQQERSLTVAVGDCLVSIGSRITGCCSTMFGRQNSRNNGNRDLQVPISSSLLYDGYGSLNTTNQFTV